MRLFSHTLAAALVYACVGDAANAQSLTGRQPEVRQVLAKRWLPMWRVGGDDDDTTFAFAREHLATGNAVYVLDAGTLQLHAFRAEGGRLWSVGSKGRGPGQLLRPVDLNLTPSGDIGVLDPGNGRVSVFSSKGELLRTITSTWAPLARSLCFTDKGSLLLHVGSSQTAIVEVDAQGRELRQWPFPWTVEDRENIFAQSMMFRRGSTKHGCALATVFGYGLAFVRDDGRITTAPYVERFALPTFVQKKLANGGVGTFLEKGDNAALQSFLVGDTTFVRVGGKHAGDLIDLYDSTGRYLATWPSPSEDRVAYANGWMFGLADGTAAPRLLAMIASTDSAKVLTDLRRRYPDRYQRKTKPTPASTPARRPPPAPRPPPVSR